MSILVIFILCFPLLVVVGTDDCMPTTCKKGGPKIRFPFRDKLKRPEYCGYPGFDVYCDESNQTMLVLPSSVHIVVKKIKYASQQLQLSDPQTCMARTDLSASPFNFSSAYLSDYILFNCSDSATASYSSPSVPCLGGSGYQVYAVYNTSDMESLPLTSCTRFRNYSSVPRDVFSGDLYLNWSQPACGICESQGRICTPTNSSTGSRGHQIQCIDKPKTNHGSKKLLIAGVTLGSFFVAVTLVALILLYHTLVTDKKKVEKLLEDYRAHKPTRFGYSDIRRVTDQFSEKLGEGGYGVVYKGKLSKDIDVAVKVLNNTKGNGEEFVNEVSTIGRIHHVNVVRLVGFCAEGFRRILVYEYLPNDSLEKFIFQSDSQRKSLGWPKLQDIALGIAKGIEYLHQGCDQRILHFDIKPHNILLDHDLNPKVSDFGLAKLCSKEQSAVTMTAARGTMGYIAPELLSRTFGRVSYKSDVYSFGMLLLEMVGGRKNVDPKVNTSQVFFPQWIYDHLNVGDELWAHIHIEEGGDDGDIARKLTVVGLQCIQWCPTDRPSMKEVVQMLEGDGSELKMPTNPFPAAKAANFVAAILEGQYQAELPLILEIE